MKFFINLVLILMLLFSFVSCETESSNKDKSKLGEVMDKHSLSTTLPDGRIRIEGKLVDVVAGEKIVVENDKGTEEYPINEKVKADITDLNINANDMVIIILKDGECIAIEKIIS